MLQSLSPMRRRPASPIPNNFKPTFQSMAQTSTHLSADELMLLRVPSVLSTFEQGRQEARRRRLRDASHWMLEPETPAEVLAKKRTG